MKKFTNLLLYLCIAALLLVPMVSAENRTITDIAGNSVSIPSDVQRAVTIDPFSSQFIYVIGAEDQLVAGCMGPHDGTVVNKTEPSLGKLPNAGCKQSVNVESLVSLKPDLVISTTTYPKANENIARLGIPVVQIDVEDIGNLTKSYEILGEIFGKQAEAKKFIDYYNGKIDTMKKDAAGLNQSKKTTVYFAQRDAQQTLGSDYYESKIVELNGGENVAASLSGGDNKVSMDQIYTWNPDYIILLPYCPQSVEDILADPAWQSLDAVKKKHVYRMPKYLMTWELPVPETILGMMWIENTLHPDKMSYDFKDEIKNFYKEFYRIDLTSDDIENILKDKTVAVLNGPQAAK